MKNETKETLEQVVSRLALTLESSPPIPLVEGDWPCISYNCTLSKDGRKIWCGDYKLGIGHVNNQINYDRRGKYGFTKDEMYGMNTYFGKPNARLADKDLAARIAAKLAKGQNVTPRITDVVQSLLMGGSCYLDAESFEEWADNMGMNSDSIKDKAIFDTCMETGRMFARAFSAEEIQSLRDAAQDY